MVLDFNTCLLCMRIIDHSSDQITSYSVHNTTIRTTVSHDDVASYLRVMHRSSPLSESGDSTVFLLDERLFSYYRFTLQLTSRTPFGIADLRQLVKTKIASLEIGHHTSECILHRLVDMSVNGEPATHILGQTGDLGFVLEICVMQPEGVALCELL